MTKVTINQIDNNPQSRNVGEGSRARTVFSQYGWLHLGGPYPVRFRLTLDRHYPAGDYEIDITSHLQPNRYGDPEVAPYSTYSLTPVLTDTSKSSKSFI